MAAEGQYTVSTFGRPRLAPGGQARLLAYQKNLLDTGTDPSLVSRLIETIEQADDLLASRLRPYELADYWQADRKAVLALFLYATRAGLLNFRWDLLCPLCRTTKSTSGTLSDLQSDVHCESCHIDFRANFERSVELTFRPNEAVRTAPAMEFCIGGPQNTPHIIYQKLLSSGEKIPPNLISNPDATDFVPWISPGGSFFCPNRAGLQNLN
ncbi:MAG: hypothetical protein HC806_06620 [Anaerolineae bacterium]|nr:hypothetical protein [Anaerolineae bacterium]